MSLHCFLLLWSHYVSLCVVFEWFYAWEITAPALVCLSVCVYVCLLQQIDFVLSNYTSCFSLSSWTSRCMLIWEEEKWAGLVSFFFFFFFWGCNIWHATSRHLFWVQGRFPVGWVYPLQWGPARSLSLSIYLSRSLAPRSPSLHPSCMCSWAFARCQPT